MTNETADLQREMRQLMVERLSSLEDAIQENRDRTTVSFDTIYEKLDRIEALSATVVAMSELAKRVRVLEDFKLKTITIIAGVQLALVVVWGIASRLLR